MADWGMKISKPGSDVLTAADKDLVYSTKYNGMKILKHNTAGATSVAHGLGYTPTFLNFKKSGSNYSLESILDGIDGTYTNGTNIVFAGADNYYFIFVDRAE